MCLPPTGFFSGMPLKLIQLSSNHYFKTNRHFKQIITMMPPPPPHTHTHTHTHTHPPREYPTSPALQLQGTPINLKKERTEVKIVINSGWSNWKLILYKLSKRKNDTVFKEKTKILTGMNWSTSTLFCLETKEVKIKHRTCISFSWKFTHWT